MMESKEKLKSLWKVKVKRDRLKNLLMKVKEESEKTGLKLKIQTNKKLRSWHLVPSPHGKYMGK